MIGKLSLGCWILFAVLVSGQPCRAEYLLGPDDNVTVRVYEWPDLSGDFRIGPNGNISFPLIGDVSVNGLSTNQLEKIVEGRLKQLAGSKDSPSVAVQIKDYRPFFIIGDVQRPGAYPYRPDLTALQAVSLAGGFFRFSDPGLLRLERDAITQRGELRILRDKLLVLKARRARLDAERAGSKEVAFPDGFDQRNPKQAALMEHENSLLRRRKGDLEKQLSQLDDLANLYRAEIQALQAQIESEKKQAELVRRELDELRGLAARGLAANPRLLLVERTIAEIEGTQRNLEALIMRARQSIAQTQQQGDELKSKFRERIDAEAEVAASEAEQTQARIETTGQLVMEAEDTAPTVIANRLRNTGMKPEFKVSRRTAWGSSEQVELGRDDQIEPGDVVQVTTSPAGTSEEAKQSRLETGQDELSGTR